MEKVVATPLRHLPFKWGNTLIAKTGRRQVLKSLRTKATTSTLSISDKLASINTSINTMSGGCSSIILIAPTRCHCQSRSQSRQRQVVFAALLFLSAELSTMRTVFSLAVPTSDIILRIRDISNQRKTAKTLVYKSRLRPETERHQRPIESEFDYKTENIYRRWHSPRCRTTRTTSGFA